MLELAMKTSLLSDLLTAVRNIRVSIEHTTEEIEQLKEKSTGDAQRQVARLKRMIKIKTQTLLSLLSCVMSVFTRARKLNLFSSLRMREQDVFTLYYLTK